jgi:hypothetical protein
MVLDGLAIASTVISLMVNGFCCLWQQQEEQKLREDIRHDVRMEYWYHRRSMDLQTDIDPDERDRPPPDANDDIRYIQEARRKKLMIDKIKIMQQRSQVQNDTSSKSDPHVFGKLLSNANSFQNTKDALCEFETNNLPNNNISCVTTFKRQSTSLLDDCDTEDEDLEDMHSPLFVDIRLD